MGKNTATPLLKDCIVQSLLLLLQEKDLEQISVREIVEKAGVNRSTYYRHFRTKLDVVRHYYALRLDEALRDIPGSIPLRQYFSGIFASFYRHKEELLMLDRLSLSFLMLEEMNARIPTICGNPRDAVRTLSLHYHLGGVFNSFRLWLLEDMATPPDKLASQCLEILPADFSPCLISKQ